MEQISFPAVSTMHIIVIFKQKYNLQDVFATLPINEKNNFP